MILVNMLSHHLNKKNYLKDKRNIKKILNLIVQKKEKMSENKKVKYHKMK